MEQGLGAPGKVYVMFTHGMRRSTIALAVATIALGGAATVAEAAIFDAVGDTATVNWFLADGADDPNGNTNTLGQNISAMAVFELTSFDSSADEIELKVTITNTTTAFEVGGEEINVGIQKFGLGTSPDATAVTLNNEGTKPDIPDDEDVFLTSELESANEFVNSATIDITSETGKGAPRALLQQKTDMFFLTITFADLGDMIELTPFDIKIQTNGPPDGPSFQLVGTEDHNGGGTDVPLPPTLLLLGAGLIGLGALSRRQRS